MKCIIFKSNLEKPSEMLIKAFNGKEVDGYYYGDLTEENIMKCAKSFTIWKPKPFQLTTKEQNAVANMLNVSVDKLKDQDNENLVWILDTYLG